MTMQLQKWMAGGVTLLGVALLAYMITVEDEPGALPLGLIAVGVVWFVLAARRRKE